MLMARLSLLLLLCGGLLTSCKQEAPDAMTTLERTVADSATTENVSQLLDMYSSWLRDNPEPSPQHKSILEKSVTVGLQHQRYAQALSALRGLVINYPDDPGTPDRLLQIGDIESKIGKDVAAKVLYQAFYTKYPDNAHSADLKQRYPMTEPVDSLITGIGRQIFHDSTAAINEEAARQYVDLCESYALVNQGSDASAEYLYKASETARTMRATVQALEIYDWLMRDYKGNKRAAQALFLTGFTYDNDLHNLDKAKAAYEEFLKKYPNDEFASSAQFLLDNLGKTDDQLLEVLQKKAAEQKK